MAITISIVVPDASVPVVKEAYEYRAIQRGDLEAGTTFTGAQAPAYIKADLVARLHEIVLVHKQDIKHGAANTAASTETNEIIIT